MQLRRKTKSLLTEKTVRGEIHHSLQTVIFIIQTGGGKSAMQAVKTDHKAGKRTFQHVLRLVLAMFLVLCFLMPMFRIGAWKNVAMKNGLQGNGISMPGAASQLQKQLSTIVRKAKLAEGVTTPVSGAAQPLRMTALAATLGLIAAFAMFLMCFAENLGVNIGRKRKPLFTVAGIAVAVLMLIGIWNFQTFAGTIRDAAMNTDEALGKVTAKLLQDNAVPEMRVTIWAWLGLAGMLLMAIVQWLPEEKGALQKSLLWFVVPALTLYTAFVITPAISSVYLAFTSYDGITEASMRFIGFDNFVNIFGSARFGSAALNTIIIAAAFTLLVNVIALALAVAVDKVRWGRNIFRSGFYLPVLISGIIAGFIWRIMFNYSFGVVNFVLNVLGMSSVKFIDVMPNALLSIIFVLLWKNAGYYMIIYLAALQGISTDLLEAASIDGANGRQTFRHITIPMLAGSFTINLTLALINGLKIYDEIAILTDGGPGFSTETITYMVYKVAFGEMRQGYGTAMAVILFLIILVFGGFQSTMLRKREVQM